MTKTLASLALASTLLAAHAAAQTPSDAFAVDYLIKGTFGADTPVTNMSAPGKMFNIEFSMFPTIMLNPPGSPLLANTPLRDGFYGLSDANGIIGWGGATGEYQFSDHGTTKQLNLSLITNAGGSLVFNWYNQNAGYQGSLAQTPTDANTWTFASGDLGNVTIDSMTLVPVTGDITTLYGLDAQVSGMAGRPIPEPSTIGLMAVGLISCGGLAWVRRNRACAC